jgi:diguanylate cyclase (GGDEF)-like protein/PAS domain S-box-containing protein
VEAMFGVEQIEIDIVGYNVIMNDITAKEEFQFLSQNLEKIVDERTHELLDKKNEIEYILDTTMEGVLILDNFICINANESAAKIGGYYSKDDIVGHHIIEFVHDKYKELVQMKMMQQQTDPWEILGLKKDGTAFPCLVRGTTFHNNEKELRVVSFIDLSDIKVKENQLLLAQAELQEQAHKDYLTGLYNRRYFAEISQDYMNLFQRENKEASVMMIDIDLFKNINDTYGHAEGDKVIKTLVDALILNTRQSDVLARFGGEEFVALLPNINVKSVLHVADKLRNYVEELDVLTDDGQNIKFTICIGVSAIKADDKTIEKAIKRADDALYIAKNSGRNRVEMV